METTDTAAEQHQAFVRSRQARRLAAYDLERATAALTAGGEPKSATIVAHLFGALWCEYEAERLDAIAAEDATFVVGFEAWLKDSLEMIRDFSTNKEKWA